MKLKKKLLKKSRLYIILDKKAIGKIPLSRVASGLKNSKAGLIQLRDKGEIKSQLLREALFLQKFFAGTNKLFIINDRVELARIVDSDGVHLGQTDTSIKTARRIFGKDKIIGISCHNLKQAVEAQESGADYIGFGPIFATPTKPEYKPVGLSLLKKLKKRIKIPVFAIGNINKGNLSDVINAGAKRVAVCRAVFNQKNIRNQADYFADYLN